jgi:penicillin-binding protein 1C
LACPFWGSLATDTAGDASRGVSSITEQVVRVLHPRPRTFWTKWLEGFEAMLLEQQRSKADILEFYLNQVPFAANRRGVVQAARFYFGRSLKNLFTFSTIPCCKCMFFANYD